VTPDGAELGMAAVPVLSADLLPDWYDDWVLLEAEDWRQLRLHALEALAGRLIALGCWGEAANAAGAAVRAEPLRESARAALIQAHLAVGNQSEAVREFTRTGRCWMPSSAWRPPPGCTSCWSACTAPRAATTATG
jgi:SARP family transcriptional regulator, regulator of embCAB operon